MSARGQQQSITQHFACPARWYSVAPGPPALGLHMKRRNFLHLAASAVALPVFSRTARSQTYPSRPITIIVPFPPGGATDVAGRILAERMRQVLGQPVIIQNVGGAGGSIGVDRAARATPDGYTIDLGQWDTHVGSVIYRVPGDVLESFEPIGLVSINPWLLVARKDFPADDVKGLVAWMKANPGNAMLVNQTAAAQLSGVLLEQLTGTSLRFIPYRGGGPALTDLIAGQVDLLAIQAAAVLPYVRSGQVKSLANLSPRRSEAIPDIPTAEESGVPGLVAPGWFGLFAPKDTPKDIIAKLNGAMVQALADPAVRARLVQVGLDVTAREQQTPEFLGAFEKAEIEKWWPIIKAAGIKGD